VSWPDLIPISALLRTSFVLPQVFYERAPEVVARELLGKIIVHGRTAGRIVEAEAYLGVKDLAAHAARGITNRTRVLFGPPAHAYVYLIYGMYECLNFVAEPEGQAGCVLIRALEPVSSLETMRSRRPAAHKIEHLCSGPGKLTLAMGITRALNGAPITRGPLTVRELRGGEKFEIAVSPRIGVTECADWPLRFFIAGNACVSRRAP
jgi:DNA-3-methyladenine glycosylase